MKRGSNQYQIKPRKRAYVAGFTFIGVCLYMVGHAVMQFNHVDFQYQAHAPTLAKVYAYTAPTPTPTPSEHDLIVAYIKEVFGDQYNNAMKILSCENPSLNPDAQGHNLNLTTDTGIFQINSIWANPALLKDWKFNIDTAKKIYDRGGWNEWACEYKYHALEK